MGVVAGSENRRVNDSTLGNPSAFDAIRDQGNARVEFANRSFTLGDEQLLDRERSFAKSMAGD
jgi:hypothetical protein